MNKVRSFLRTIGILRSALPRDRAGFLLSTLLTGIVLAGWSGSAQATITTTQSTKVLIVSQGNTPTPESLPGTEEFGLSMKELETSVEAVETLIATCMNDAGFEYIAADFNTIRSGMVADKSFLGLSEREYADQYGFGISTLYTGLPPQLADMSTPAQIGLGGNRRFFQSQTLQSINTQHNETYPRIPHRRHRNPLRPSCLCGRWQTEHHRHSLRRLRLRQRRVLRRESRARAHAEH